MNLSNTAVKESNLDPSVQDLVKLIFDVKTMEKMVAEMNYDFKKGNLDDLKFKGFHLILILASICVSIAPLGRLSSSQIKAGYKALQQVEKLIST